VPGNEWDIYGPKGLNQSLRETLAGQMEHTYFPITPDQFGASIRYHDLLEVFAVSLTAESAPWLAIDPPIAPTQPPS